MVLSANEVKEDIRRRAQSYYKICKEYKELGQICLFDAPRIGYLCNEEMKEDVNELFWSEYKKLKELDGILTSS